MQTKRTLNTLLGATRRLNHQAVLHLERRGDSADEVLLVLVRDVLQCALLGLGEEQRGEDARQHEQGENLEKMVDELRRVRHRRIIQVGGNDAAAHLVLPADVLEAGETDLGNNCAELAARRRDAMCGRAVPGRERLTGDDERGRIRAEILEKVGEAVEEHERTLALVEDGVVAEALREKGQFRCRGSGEDYCTMMMKRLVSIMKPMSWIGRRPHYTDGSVD